MKKKPKLLLEWVAKSRWEMASKLITEERENKYWISIKRRKSEFTLQKGEKKQNRDGKMVFLYKKMEEVKK